MSNDKGWTRSTPLLRIVRASVRKHKRIDHDVLQVGRNEAEQHVIDSALRHLQGDHKNRWRSRVMLGSLLKRIRSREVAA